MEANPGVAGHQELHGTRIAIIGTNNLHETFRQKDLHE